MQVCFLSNVCVLSCSYLEFKYTVLLLDQDQESVYMHTAHTPFTKQQFTSSSSS